MVLSRENIKQTALSANLDISEEELDVYVKRIGDILEPMKQLKDIPIEGVDPTVNVLTINNIFREDIIEEGLTREQAVKNAPDVEDGQFKVPKIV